MYQPTSALHKIAKLRKRIRAVAGGTGAAKTVSILQWLIDYAQTHHNEVIDVVSTSYPHLDSGVIHEFKAIMLAQGYWEDERWNGGAPRHYTFKGTNTVLNFTSIDSVGKAHGPRRDVMFVNEANNLSWPIVDQLITRTRKIVFLDWNPVSDFWFYTEVLGKRDDVDFIGDGGEFPPLTYLDNEALDEGQKQEILSHQNNTAWWKVYGLGLRGIVEGRIFSGWRVIDEIPHEARLERYGLDFGYSNDPTALIAIYYYNGGYIFDEILYQKGLSYKQIADTILNQRKGLTIADSAEPRGIDEIGSFGVNIQPATKGKDSVEAGIALMQDQPISYTRRSVNLEREYHNYLWQQDKDGRWLRTPIPIWNHAMDAIRYGMASLIPMIQRADMIASMPRYERTQKRAARHR